MDCPPLPIRSSLHFQQIVITIKAVEIGFDDAKNERNLRDRGLSFERVAEFDFSTTVIGQDTRNEYPEPRFVALGFLDTRLHVLCFTPLADGLRRHQLPQGQRPRAKEL